MANRYWIGGTGNINDTAHWSTTNGGSGGASVPTIDDDVMFNVNSFTTTGQIVTINAVPFICASMNWTGVLNTPTLNFTSGNTPTIAGNLTLVSGMIMDATYKGRFVLQGSGTHTVTTAGHSMGYISFWGTGTYTLQDDLTCADSSGSTNLTHSKGTLDTNGKSISCYKFWSINANTKVLTLGASVINLDSDWEISNPSYLTLNAGTSTIKMNASYMQFIGGGKTYYNVELKETHTVIIDNNTFNDLKLFAGKIYIFNVNNTQTVTTFTGDGTVGNLITIQCTSGLGTYTISKASGTVTKNYYNIKGCIATGGATFIANNYINSGYNSGWKFPKYWVGNGGNWNDTAHWATASGGSGGYPIPDSTNDVYFNVNSFNTTGQTVTINVTSTCLDMDWTGAINTPTLSGTQVLNIYGSLKYINAMIVTYSGQTICRSTTIGRTITTASNSLGQIAFYGSGGEWTLQDDLTISSIWGLELLEGTLNTNNKNINTSAFSMGDTSRIRSIVLGSSVITCSWSLDFSVSTNLTLNAGTSKIILTGNNTRFDGGGLIYNDVELQGGSIVISGNNTFNDLKFIAGNTIKVVSGTTQIINTMSGNGTVGNLINLQSYTSTHSFTLSKATGTINISYYNIQDVIATGGATFNATDSTNISGNTGWNWLFSWIAPNLKPKVGGVLKTYSDGWVKIDGVLKHIDSIWTKIDGVLKKL